MCRQSGLYCVADLAAGWARQSGQMPLPMPCFAIRGDLPDEVRLGIETALRDSIRYALAHRAEASAFAAQCAHGMACWEADPAALGTYVSERSLDMDDPQRLAVEEFLRRGHDAQIVPDALPIRFVGS
jgi:1,4-dihydroxy-6-naphthoate synthase